MSHDLFRPYGASSILIGVLPRAHALGYYIPPLRG